MNPDSKGSAAMAGESKTCWENATMRAAEKSLFMGWFGNWDVLGDGLEESPGAGEIPDSHPDYGKF